MNIEEFLRVMRDIKSDFGNEIQELAERFEARLTKALSEFVGDVQLSDNKVPMERSR